MRPASRRVRIVGYSLLGALAYVPVLLTDRGRVAADTKSYLYLDPARMLGRAASMWDPNIGLGTVTHQNIGYLFPMGPFYWGFDSIGIPDWVAQRLWLGTIVLAAGLGMLFLFRTLGVRGSGAVVGALAFMLSPYSLDYAARISVILLPWAALPWMLGVTIRALRRGGWYHAALFALVVQVVGSVNATALVFAGVAPVLWVLWAVGTREVDWRRALATVARIGVLTVAASLWWIAGLSLQGGYGINILRYTETVETVARTSLAPEVLRGLGYWFFYGQDKIGPWIEANVNYTQHPWLIVVSYLVPALALLSAGLVRWRHRGYFVLLSLAGVAIAVGAEPFSDPSPLGALFKAFAEGSTAGLALRSTGRAVPLVVLGLAVLLGVGANAVAARVKEPPRRALAVPCIVGALVVLNFPALWDGSYYGDNLQRDEDVPEYWQEAIASLDARPLETRVLELPGADFASYRWGNTVDPITPGLTDRPYVARELIPYGAPASADLLNAIDRRVQENLLAPEAIAPLARLIAVGDILLRYDIQHERYNLVRPDELASLFTPTPTGLSEPVELGVLDDNGAFPLVDERRLSAEYDGGTPPALAIYGVEEPEPIVRSAARAGSVVVAGDGEGLVDAASIGVIGGRSLVLYSASYAAEPDALRSEIDDDGVLVVTDSNRRRARRWSTVRDNVGFTETADEEPLAEDLSDARLEVFPDAGVDAYSVTELSGVHSVRATAYGNPVSYTPEDRPANAIDGDPTTAWMVGAFADVVGDRIRVELDEPITTDRIDLVQGYEPADNRWITEATLRFGDSDPVAVTFTDASRTAAGQTVELPEARTFETLEIEIDGTNVGRRATFNAAAVGLAEIRMRDQGAADVRVHETVRMPTDLLDVAGAASLDNDLVFVMTRERVLPVPPRLDPERTLSRVFELPTERTFSLGGEARIAPEADEAVIDEALGYPGPEAGGMAARSSEHLLGTVRSRARMAVDGDPATAWSTRFVGVEGRGLEVDVPAPLTLDHLDLQVVADGRHSVPTRLEIGFAGGPTRTVELPPIPEGSEPGDVATVPVDFEPITGTQLVVTIAGTRELSTVEYFSEREVTLPVAIAELGLGIVPAAPGAELPQRCRNDLVTVDGSPLPVRIVGERAAAETRGAASVQPCDPADPAAVPAITLAAGRHVVETTSGAAAGFHIDRLVLGSVAGDAAMPLGDLGRLDDPPEPPTGPAARVVEQGRTSLTVEVAATADPVWLVLGQSQNPGWRAEVDGRSLGPARLVNGYANGWVVEPTTGGEPMTVTLEWTPQRRVWTAIAVSALAVLLCVVVVAVGLVRGQRRHDRVAVPPPDEVAADEPVVVSPLVAGGARPGITTVVATAVFSAAVATVLYRAWVGVLVGALVALVLVRPRFRAVLSLGPALLLLLCGLVIAAQQYRWELESIFEWPTYHWRARTLGWLAILLIAADVVVELVRRRASPGSPKDRR